MKNPSNNMLRLIGDTPLVKLSKISKNCPAEIWAKIEFTNPSGSIKDRIALRMIEEAEKRGDITPGATIVEPTSGNTGIALAFICAVKGYKMIAVLPEAMSVERIRIMEQYGAKVVVVPSIGDPSKGFTKEDIENTLNKAIEITENTPNSFMPNQFENPDNPATHADTTGLEIWEQTEGKIKAYVAASGTGGSFSGVAQKLKEKKPNIITAVVEPKNNAVMLGNAPGFHKIQGIGEGFIPENMNMSLADKIIPIGDEEAIEMAQKLAKEEGILCGISSGANVLAALAVGNTLPEGSTVVTLIPDNAYRYFSAELFDKPKKKIMDAQLN